MTRRGHGQDCYAIVTRRAKGWCERCGIAISPRRPEWHPQRAHMNHKVPLSQGGLTTPDNCELICQSCHQAYGHAPTADRMETLRSQRRSSEWP